MKGYQAIFIKRVVAFFIILCTASVVMGETKKEAELINLLQVGNGEEKERASKELAELGEKVLPALEQYLNKVDHPLNYEITKVLAKIEIEKSTILLEKVAINKEETDPARLVAINGLKNRKINSGIVIDLLKDENFHIRYQSIELISEDTADVKIIEALNERLLTEEDWRIKKKIATKLSKLSNVEAAVKVCAILKVLKEECKNPIIIDEKTAEDNMDVPITGGRYLYDLVNIGSPAIPFLKREIQGESGEVREIIIIALGLLKDEEAFSPLLDLALNSQNGWIRSDAVRALGEFGNKEAIPILEKALKDDFSIRAFPIDVKVPAGYEYMQIYYPVRQSAFFALKKMGVEVKQKGINSTEYHEYIIIKK